MENKYIELKKLLSIYNPNLRLSEILELIEPFCELEMAYNCRNDDAKDYSQNLQRLEEEKKGKIYTIPVDSLSVEELKNELGVEKEEIEKPKDKFDELRDLVNKQTKPIEDVKQLDGKRINKLTDKIYDRFKKDDEMDDNYLEGKEKEVGDDVGDVDGIARIRCEKCKKRINILDKEERGVYHLTGMCVNCFDEVSKHE